jgi:hypothetical protein
MLIHWIPDVPKTIEDQIEREKYITQKALWQTKPEIKSSNKKKLNAVRFSELN